MNSARESLRRRMVFDDLQAHLHPWILDIDRAVRENPDCEIGLMARQGWVYSQNGPNSDGDRPELLVWLTQGSIRRTPAGCGWYGHVFFLGDEPGGSDSNRKTDESSGSWISILVRTSVRPDGTDSDQVLRQWRNLVVTGHSWVPGYYQASDDTCASRSSFPEAVQTLIAQIRIFRRVDREEKLVGHDDYGDFKFPLYEDPEGGVEDQSPMVVYRFSSRLCAEFLKDL